MIKIPAKFIENHATDILKEIYINENNINVFEVSKRIEKVWDRETKSYTDELETVYQVAFILNSGYYVPIKGNFNEKLFQEFILWANKTLAFANIKEKQND